MPQLPKINGREVLKILVKAGFYVHRQSGSHVRVLHRTRPELRITIPVHGKDLPERTLRSILRQADITPDKFNRLIKD